MSFATITMKGRLGRDPELNKSDKIKFVNWQSQQVSDGMTKVVSVKKKLHGIMWSIGASKQKTWLSFFKKGDEIFVMGDVTSDEWTDQQGQKRTAQKVKGFKFDFVGGNQTQQAQPQQQVSNPGYGNIPQNMPNFNNQMQGEPKPSTVDSGIPF